jgi:hypothetical protein
LCRPRLTHENPPAEPFRENHRKQLTKSGERND